MKVQRFDKMLITDSMYKKDSQGFLTVTAPITRPGVFPYQTNDGTIRMEAKLPEDVFSDLAIYSARGKAVTDNHPGELVTIQNINRYSKGMTHTDSRIEDYKLVVSMTITDEALIERIYSGEQSEISIGFLSDIIEQRGTYDNAEYTAVQRNIEINHVAIVDKGRAGPSVAIRADSAAWQIESEKGGTPNMAVYKIDEQEFELDSAVVGHITDLKKKLDAANGTIAGKDTTIDGLKNDMKDLEAKVLSEDEIAKKVEARVALIADAKPLLEDSFDFAGKTDREIKEAVILSAKPDFKGDGLSDDYVNAFYDARLEMLKQDGFKSTGESHMQTDSKPAASKVDELKNKRLNMNK